MYEQFYGFREKPFSLLPDAEFLYFSENHRSAYNVLEYSLTGQAGFTIITGEVGSGKTTLVQTFLKQVGVNTNIGLITNTPRSFDDLMKWVLLAFDLDYQTKERVELYRTFTDFLIAQNAAGRRSMLIVDEAQNLDVETLEELRMLSNVNVSKSLMLQIVLVGQPELLDLLNQPDLRQFAQRISMSYQLTALTQGETQAYIRHRLAVGGGDPLIFTGAACDAVFHLSKGVPRLINGLCDVALVYGFGEERSQIDVDVVLAVYADRSESGLGMGTNWPDKEELANEIAQLAVAVDDTADVPPNALAASQSVTGGIKKIANGSSLADYLPTYTLDPGLRMHGVPNERDETREDIGDAESAQWKPSNVAEKPSRTPNTTALKSKAPEIKTQEVGGPTADSRGVPAEMKNAFSPSSKQFVPVFGERRLYQAAGRSVRTTILRWVLMLIAIVSILIGGWLVLISQGMI
jgi:type II secretory pathway predicted ATPase ExeA